MGCYGIGVTRLLGAAIEQNHDERGIIWPVAIAPFAVVICPIGWTAASQVRAAAEQLYADCWPPGVDVLLDDRGERPGAMFADWELIGVPHRVVLSDRGLKEGQAEYQGRRDAAATNVPVASCCEGPLAGAPHGVPGRATGAATAAGSADRRRRGAGRRPVRRSRSRWPIRCARRCRPPLRRAAAAAVRRHRARLVVPALAREMSDRLQAPQEARPHAHRVPQTVWYESKRRAGLETGLVLGLIQVESGFRKYAISSAGARGYMQVMPFWTRVIGDGDPRAVPHADQPALRLRDPAPLPGPRARRPVHGAGALQRQPRQAPNTRTRCWRAAPVARCLRRR
jgi:hypothetical protein